MRRSLQNIVLMIEKCCGPCDVASVDQRSTSGDVKGVPCGTSDASSIRRSARVVNGSDARS